MSLISNFEKGSNITILDTHYNNFGTGKDKQDILTIIYKDLDTGLKHHEDIISPDYEFYLLNEDEYIDYKPLFIEKEKTHVVKCKYKDRLKKIAEVTNNKEYYYDNIKNGNYSANNKLQTCNELFLSDIDLNDYIRLKFDTEYQNQTFTPSKAFLDIETRIKDMPLSDSITDHMGEYPVDVVTLINDHSKLISTFILRDDKNPQVAMLEREVMNGTFNKELHDFIIESCGGWKKAHRLGLDCYQYEQIFYDDELQLLQDLFIMINITQPDFLMAWNMPFDIPYIIKRLEYLGVNPADIMCHPHFKYKNCYYYIDKMHENEFELKGDYACISGYTCYEDQLKHYASRRKGQSKLPNYKLDTVAKATCGFGKYDYFDPSIPFGERQYINFKNHILYNIMDTVCQAGIEHKVDDIGYIFNKALMNNTRLHKIHRQTVYLTNRGIKEFLESGLVMGSNANKFKQLDTKKNFEGAINGDPLHVCMDGFERINGRPIYVIKNGNDFDFKALYPSELDQNNIAPNTIIAKGESKCKINPNENPFNKEHFDRIGTMFEDFQSDAVTEFGHRYLNLANYEELLGDIKEYFETVAREAFIMPVDVNTGLQVAVKIYGNCDVPLPAVAFDNKDQELQPVVMFINPRTNMYKTFEGVEYEYYEPFNK